MEAPESGQNEEVTDPSDEGNSDTEGDDIANEDPAEEDPVTEEPSEGDVEEIEEPTIGLMGGDGEINPLANTFNVTWEESQDYTITGEKTAEEEEDYTFTVVAAKSDYRIKTVKYKVAGSEEETTLTAGGDDNITYTIESSKITGDITIIVEAVQTFKVTVTAPDTVTVQYTVNDTVLDNATSPVTVDKGDKVKLTVTPKDATYDVVVKKGSTVVPVAQGEANVYDLGEIGANATYTVTATKNRYTITETINQITVTDEEDNEETVPSATINYGESGSDYTPAEDQKPQMIAKSKDLKFTLKYNDYFDGKTPKVVVSYKVGADEKATTLTANSSGVYTIQKAKITGDIALDVYVDEYKTFAVTMNPDENVDTIQYAIGTEALKDFPAAAEDAENGERVLEDVTEDSVLKFTVAAKKYYKIKEVKASDEVLKADTKGVYTLTVSEAKTITVTTEEDSAQKRSLAFKVTGDAKSASAAFTDGLNVSKSVEAGETVELAATTGDEVTLTITPKAGYIIKTVTGATEVTGAAAADTGAKQYTVKFTAAKTANVTVTTDAAESTKESKVTFTEDVSVSHMSYTVKTGGTTKVTKEEDGRYTVAEGAKKLEFTITVTGSYKPTVNVSGKDASVGEDNEDNDDEDSEGTEFDPAKVTLTKTGATYDYVIPATQLKDDNFVTISESKDERTITLGGSGFDNVDIVASIDGTKTSANVNSQDKEYTVLLNTVVAFQITAKTNTDLTEVVSKIGSNGKDTYAKITNNTATVEVKVTDDTTINITTKDQYVASKLKENGTELKPADEKKNSYNVAYNGTYTAEVVKGKNPDPAALSKVNVLLGNNPVAAKTDGDSVGAIDTTDTNKASIDLSKADVTAIAGKTLTVELYASEGTGNDATDVKVATYSLIVSVPAKDIKIDKKDKLEATQAIDTTKTYTVTAAKGVDLNKLEATVVDTKGIIATVENDDEQNSETPKPQVAYENGKLTVTMAAKAPESATATITIKEQGVEDDDASTATLTITPAALINGNTKAPTVKLVAATDVAFKLTLSADKTIGNAASGNLYYKVESKVKGAADDSTKKETYVQKEGDSQTAMVTVSDAASGSGSPADYEVTASLVHLDKAVKNETTLDDDTETLGTSKASNVQTLKTQTPAYEDKLKLKKINATVITGQQNVEIAEPQYNKYTTFLSLAPGNAAVKDITPNISEDAKLAVKVTTSGSDEKITATATDKTWIGKHKIQVTASAEPGAVASVATIDVTVVRGIHKLSVTVPSTNLYKANKKPAKVKATAVYNQIENMTSPAPKNKNVTWEIVGQGENASYIEKMVTVKNGTVTVDKSFIVDTVETNNQFKIRVTANNEKTFAGGTYDNDGNLTPIVGESSVITITGTGEDIKTIAIKKDNETKTFSTGEKVQASDIDGGEVVVLDSKGTEIDLDLLTLKSSNQKSVAVYASGWIEVNKVGKVKLTATANDGSNNKAELSLDVINDETTEDLSLQIVKAHYEYDESSSWPAKDTAADEDAWKAIALYDPNGSVDATAIKYDGSTTPLIAVQVMQKIEDTENNKTYYQDSVPYFANYKLTVNGGKIVAQWGDTAYIATNATAKTVTLKLTNAAVKSSAAKEFILTNTGVQEKPTFKVLNKLHSLGAVAEQTANIEVTKLPADAANLVAKVEVDWSAKNAKNEADLAEFAGMLKDYYEVKVADNKGSFTLALESDDEMIYLNQKSYKLTVTLGTTEATNVDSEEVTTFAEAKALPTTMTVSVDSAKKFTFKPVTSYTLTTKDAKASAPLTGKASITDCTVEWDTTLQNLNTKGVTNSFAEYFQVVDGTIQLRTGKTFPADKADCTGYITYTATAGSNYYNVKKISDTVKITVKLDEKKTVKKYAQKKDEAVTIVKTVGSKATVTIDATEGEDSAAADLAYVMVDPKDSNKGFTAALPTGEGDNTGKVELTWGGENELKVGKTLTVKLLVVPTSSYYTTSIAAEAGDAAAQKELIKTYGISTSAKVKVVETATVEPEAEITVTVSAVPSSVVSGSQQDVQCSAVAKEGDTEIQGAEFTWSVAANDNSTKATDTDIDTTGKLSVAADQTAGTLIVTATYTPKGGAAVSGTTEVTVTNGN